MRIGCREASCGRWQGRVGACLHRLELFADVDSDETRPPRSGNVNLLGVASLLHSSCTTWQSPSWWTGSDLAEQETRVAAKKPTNSDHEED